MCFMPSLFPQRPGEASVRATRHRFCLRTMRLATSFPMLSPRMRVFCLSALALVVAAVPSRAADEWDAVVDKAVAFLKTSQNADGSWGPQPQNRGITGIV